MLLPQSPEERGELAFAWWKQGFAELRTEEDFSVLLDEMQGLGILREKTGEYALRAINLLSLLGSQEQIEQKLLQSADEAPPEPYSAQSHRTSDRKQSWKRNPLTDQQYNDLRGERNCVSLIFGCRAAGLDDVERFLAQAVDSSHFINCEISGSDRFARKVKAEQRSCWCAPARGRPHGSRQRRQDQKDEPGSPASSLWQTPRRLGAWLRILT